MYKIDFNNPIHIHFIGIGGISMSGLAKILLSEGFTVSGSDSHSSALTDELTGDGCLVSVPQSAGNITNDIDLVVYTAAIHPDNPEFKAAKEAGLPMLTRAELLGQIMTMYKNAINIAGTHGKTTTTSMVSEILLAANMDPTISVGGILNSIGGNTRVGGNKYFVAEACEYTNSFLSFNPTMNIILNVKEDHLDFFKDIDDIRHSFKLLLKNFHLTELLSSILTLIIMNISIRILTAKSLHLVLTLQRACTVLLISLMTSLEDALILFLLMERRLTLLLLVYRGFTMFTILLLLLPLQESFLLIWSISRQVFLTLRVLTEDLRRRVHLTVLLSLMIMHITLMKSVLL